MSVLDNGQHGHTAGRREHGVKTFSATDWNDPVGTQELWRKDSCQDGAEARSTESWGGIKVLDKAGRSGVREETGAEGNGASQANRRLVKL